jgi:hypothetical protein
MTDQPASIKNPTKLSLRHCFMVFCGLESWRRFYLFCFWTVNLPVRADDGRFDGTVIFLRHALAPGNGDPANFNLKDCADPAQS